MADTDPLEFHIRRHPDLDVLEHGLTLWDLDRVFPVGGFAGKQKMKLRDVLGVLRDSYCRRVGVEYMHIQDPRGAALDPGAGRSAVRASRSADRSRSTSSTGSTRPRCSRPSCRPSTSASGASRWRARESLIPLLRRDPPECRRRRAGRGRHRHGAPRPAQRAGQHRRQAVREDLRRVRGAPDPKSAHGSGDVKYHLGLSGKFTTADESTRSPCRWWPTRRHLEAVDPVVEGIVRAKQDRLDLGREGYTVLPLRGPRRRRLRRPGRGGRDAQPVPAARATAPAAPSTSSSTTRSASPPPRSTAARRLTPPTWPR